MKALIFPLICAALFLGLNACKEKSNEFVVPKTANSSTTDQAKENRGSDALSRYVIAPSGLSLRKENNLASEKLVGMPLGAKVELIAESEDTSLEVEHIKGGMHKVTFEGQIGYAFDGYLSPIRLYKKGESIPDYIADLKTSYPNINYDTKPNGPDFHEGAADHYTLPATSWHEAYYLVSAIYQLPKSLGFPNPEGPAESRIEDPNKPAVAWDSFVTATRKDNALEKIAYTYRTEGFGYGLSIVRESETLFRIEYLAFVD